MSSLFAVEPLLTERLRLQIPGLRAVQGARDAETARALRPLAPSAFLILEGQEARQAAAHQQVVEQIWQILLVVRHAGDESGAAERNEAGPLLEAVIQTLLGWKPASGFAPWRLASVKAPHFAHGHAYYPLRFVCPLRLLGAA